MDLKQIKFLFVFYTETLKSCPAVLGLLYTSDGQIVWQQLDYITEFWLFILYISLSDFLQCWSSGSKYLKHNHAELWVNQFLA